MVDVLGAKTFKDGEQIIEQVNVWFWFVRLYSWTKMKMFDRLCVFFKQGDAADCFYIVESGAVKITIKRQVNCALVKCLKMEDRISYHTIYFTTVVIHAKNKSLYVVLDEKHCSKATLWHHQKGSASTVTLLN